MPNSQTKCKHFLSLFTLHVIIHIYVLHIDCSEKVDAHVIETSLKRGGTDKRITRDAEGEEGEESEEEDEEDGDGGGGGGRSDSISSSGSGSSNNGRSSSNGGGGGGGGRRKKRRKVGGAPSPNPMEAAMLRMMGIVCDKMQNEP